MRRTIFDLKRSTDSARGHHDPDVVQASCSHEVNQTRPTPAAPELSTQIPYDSQQHSDGKSREYNTEFGHNFYHQVHVT